MATASFLLHLLKDDLTTSFTGNSCPHHLIHYERIICRVVESCGKMLKHQSTCTHCLPVHGGGVNRSPPQKNTKASEIVAPFPLWENINPHATQVHIWQGQPCFQAWIITFTRLDRPSTPEAVWNVERSWNTLAATYSSQTWHIYTLPRELRAGSYQYVFSCLYLEPPKEGPVTTLLLT